MLRKLFIATLAAASMAVAAPAQANPWSGVCHHVNGSYKETMGCKIVGNPSEHLSIRLIWSDGTVRNYKRTDRQSMTWTDDRGIVWQVAGNDDGLRLVDGDVMIQVDAAAEELRDRHGRLVR